jgi:patatin-like phospholipase/acyl hydrolase
MARTRPAPGGSVRNQDQFVVPRSVGTQYTRRVRQDWPADRDFRILSIDGGGIRGILPLAFLAGLESAHLRGRSVADYFDLIAGTSTGGIIGLGLARGLTATEILDIYVRRGGEVFPDLNPVSQWMLGKLQLVRNRCDTDALYRLIDDVVGDRQLWQSSKRLCIPAAETRHFEPFIFKTPHHQDYRLDWCKPMSLVAKTTSAAPAHFRPVQSGGYEFIDGGVWANNPIMTAVADALACFDIRREQIKVMSLGCGQTHYEMSWARRTFGGMLTWTSLMVETMQIQSANVVGQARLIAGGDRILRIESAPTRRPIELWNWARARSELPAEGARLVDLLGGVAVREFLYGPAAPYSPIYTPNSPSSD